MTLEVPIVQKVSQDVSTLTIAGSSGSIYKNKNAFLLWLKNPSWTFFYGYIFNCTLTKQSLQQDYCGIIYKGETLKTTHKHWQCHLWYNHKNIMQLQKWMRKYFVFFCEKITRIINKVQIYNIHINTFYISRMYIVICIHYIYSTLHSMF